MSELAEGARLEIVYTSKGYLGFESPSLRQKIKAPTRGGFFKTRGASDRVSRGN
jgi:hypothetical protein